MCWNNTHVGEGITRATQSERIKKVVTTKYLAKFQIPTAVSWPKIIQPE
jgi:hypothetical protein